MKFGKIILVLLVFSWLLFGGFQIYGLFQQKEEASDYINHVNKWNDKLIALQERYKEEVIDEKNREKALRSLKSIVEDNKALTQRTENFKSSYDAVNIASASYEKGLHAIGDAYQLFYFGLMTNEASLLDAGEEALDEADRWFRSHENQMQEVARKNFIQLQ